MGIKVSFFSYRERGLKKFRSLYLGFCRLRTREFVHRLGWADLKVNKEGGEEDQYDNQTAWYLIVHEGAKVLGGCRLMPTTAEFGPWSYMIRDASKGILGGSIPETLTYDPSPQNQKIWEVTRVAVDSGLPEGLRQEIRKLLPRAMVYAVQRYCWADHILAYTFAIWPRVYQFPGLRAKPIGPIAEIGKSRYQCVIIDVKESRSRRFLLSA